MMSPPSLSPVECAPLVWALAQNASRRFYEALGGALVFEQEIVIAGQTLQEVGYGWPDIQALIERTASR
jgi:hypothetical protein